MAFWIDWSPASYSRDSERLTPSADLIPKRIAITLEIAEHSLLLQTCNGDKDIVAGYARLESN